MFSVEATRPPTFTLAPAPNNTPFGLTRKTLPLADKLPKIADGSLPVTRLSATDCAFGWLNTTRPFAPIENDCQLMTTFCEFCCTFIWPVPGRVTLALPCTTLGALGSVCAKTRAGAKASATANAEGRRRNSG